MIECVHSQFHLLATVSNFQFCGGSPEYAFGCPDCGFRSQHRNQICLLVFDKQVWAYSEKQRIELRPFDAPSVGSTPSARRTSADRSKDCATGNLSTTLDERPIAIRSADSWGIEINPTGLSGLKNLETSLSFEEPSEPRPFLAHGVDISYRGCSCNPGYAEMSERRIRDDAGMFAEVAAE